MAKRRGRKRSAQAERHPGGQIKKRTGRRQRADDARQSAIEARTRLFRVPAEEAHTDEAGSVLGRLSLSGELDSDRETCRAMYEAGKDYERTRARYRWALDIRRAMAGGDFERSTPGYEGGEVPASWPNSHEEYEEACRTAERAWGDMRRELLEADPFALMACETIIDEDRRAPSLIEALRCALKAIMRQPGKRRAA